jgi:hypothetical protein
MEPCQKKILESTVLPICYTARRISRVGWSPYHKADGSARLICSLKPRQSKLFHMKLELHGTRALPSFFGWSIWPAGRRWRVRPAGAGAGINHNRSSHVLRAVGVHTPPCSLNSQCHRILFVPTVTSARTG